MQIKAFLYFNIMKPLIALFGESEKGCFNTAHICHSLSDLCETLGFANSNGISLAIQSILHNFSVIFFRVKEEGFCPDSYFFGLHFLKTQKEIHHITAVAMPGIGQSDIISSMTSLCNKYNSLLIFSEQDLYDLFTSD